MGYGERWYLTAGCGARQTGERSLARLLPEVLNGGCDGGHNLAHEREVQRLGLVRAPVIVRIPEERRVGDHERRVAVIPERRVVREPGVRHQPAAKRRTERDDRQVGYGSSSALGERPEQSPR